MIMYNDAYFTQQTEFLARIDELMEDNTLTTIERDEKIKTCFIGMMFDIAGKCKPYLQWKKRLQANGKDIKPIDDLLACFGQMIRSNLTMWKEYGADYKALVSVLNANPDFITQIEADHNENEPFADLILHYGLAKAKYPEIELALIKGYNIIASNEVSDLRDDLLDKTADSED